LNPIPEKQVLCDVNFKEEMALQGIYAFSAQDGFAYYYSLWKDFYRASPEIEQKVVLALEMGAL
jgi:hypothetical protein